jgi:hypothetical protein
MQYSRTRHEVAGIEVGGVANSSLSPVTAQDRERREAVRMRTALVRLFEPLPSGTIKRNSRESTADSKAALSI